MRRVSALFRQTMEERRDFYASAEITFADGAEMTLGKRDFTLSGNTITESAESTSFPLGILAGRRITITLENSDDRWSKYDFFGARIALRTCFDLPDGTTETLNIGTFTVISPESYGETVSITAMDGSYKADKPYTTARAYPMTAGVALQDACQTCDIDLGTQSFANDDFLIQQAPKDITFRQYIGCIAMLAGGNAVMDEYNRLTIKTYDFTPFERFSGLNGGEFDQLSTDRYMTGDTADGGSFKPWDTGDTADGGAFGDRDDTHVLYQFSGVPVIESDDVVITGIQFTNEDEEGNQTAHLYGSDGYVLALENPLLAGQEDAAAALIGAKIVGLRFRPFSGNHIALPTAQFMDLAWILDRKGNGHQSVITDVDFTYFGYTVLKCAADSPIRNSSTYYGQATKAVVQARQMVEKERTDRQKAFDTLAQELAQSSGLYMTQERKDDGSTIYYMHDKPNLKDSAIVWKLTANALGISTDGGKSYPYGLDATGTAILNRIYAIGLNADYINAGRLEVRDESGRTTFLADTKTGEVQIVARSFSLTSGDTIGSIAEEAASSAAGEALKNANSYTDESASSTLASANSHSDSAAADALAGAKEYTDETAESTLTDANEYSDTAASGALESAKGYADKSLSDFVDKTYDPKIAELQKQIDGQIENYFYDYVPTLNNAPANGWTDETEKAKHEGDIFYNKTTGYAYRFFKDGNTWKWQLIQDTDITKAIEAAAAAQDTADGKRRTFLTTPTTPYDEGDIWMQGSSGDIMVCVSSRQNGAHVSSDWEKRNKYIDNAVVTSAVTVVDNKITAEVTRAEEEEKSIRAALEISDGNISAEIERAMTAEEALSSILSVTDGRISAEVTRATDAEEALSASLSVAEGNITAEVTRATRAEGALQSSVNINTESITTKVSKGDVSSEISQEAGAVSIKSNRLTVDSTCFKVNGNGNVTANGSFITRSGDPFSGVDQYAITEMSAGEIDIGVGDVISSVTGGKITAQDYQWPASSDTHHSSIGLCLSTFLGPVCIGKNQFSLGKLNSWSLTCDIDPEQATYYGMYSSQPNQFIGTVGFGSGLCNGASYYFDKDKDDDKGYMCPGVIGGTDPCALFTKSVAVQGRLLVQGQKDRLVDSENFGGILMNAWETTGAYFSDIGSGKVGSDGICEIVCDNIFAETIDGSHELYVSVTKTSPGEIDYVEKKGTFMVVRGTPGTTFDWIVTGKQRDYTFERMESASIDEVINEAPLPEPLDEEESLAASYLDRENKKDIYDYNAACYLAMFMEELEEW